MSDFDTSTAVKALNRAREADDNFWSRINHGGGAGQFRKTRNSAILEAINAGMSLEQIADELGVLISDVERMAASARPH